MAFHPPLKQVGVEITGDFSKEIRTIALRVLRGLVLASPVDTGRFVNNWVVGILVKNPRTVDTNGDSGTIQTGAIRRGEITIRTHKGFQDIWISNNLPYAERLENGWSEQAPTGMVANVLAREADK